jgi:putative salt-induced outer membrane protein YdiY
VDEKLGNEYLNYATLRGAEKFHYVLSEWARLWESAEILPEVDNFDNYILNVEVGVEADLNKRKNLALRVVLDDTYNNIPAPGREKNDLKLVASLACKF